MSSETCETVKVVAENEQGYIVINASDVTPEHVLFVEPAREPTEEEIEQEEKVTGRRRR